jgi:DNA ligase D-like protein (predicted 3'-phosphoesterase)
MLLEEYRAKRKFQKTPEPKGKIKKSKFTRFVIQKHQATHLHYDFRLEMEGVLKSWAIPKGLPEKKGIKRLAVQVEDHPVEYINFEGEIPRGLYGAGKVEIWDRGDYKLIAKTRDRIEFELFGKKAQGCYVLVKLKKSKYKTKKPQWLIFRG